MKSVTLAVIAAWLAASPSSHAQQDARFVAVDGHATVTVSPDSATLRFAAQARNAELDVARSEVLEITRRFLDFADDERIDDDAIRSSGLNIRPQYRWNPDEDRQELLGYLVQRDITIQLDDIARLGDMMEGAIGAGINQVQPPQLTHSKEKDLRRRALAEATRDARANAEQIAKTLGVRLGGIRNVSAQQTMAPRPPYAEMAMLRTADASSGAETYLPGQITIEARVSAEFDLDGND